MPAAELQTLILSFPGMSELEPDKHHCLLCVDKLTCDSMPSAGSSVLPMLPAHKRLTSGQPTNQAGPAEPAAHAELLNQAVHQTRRRVLSLLCLLLLALMRQLYILTPTGGLIVLPWTWCFACCLQWCWPHMVQLQH